MGRSESESSMSVSLIQVSAVIDVGVHFSVERRCLSNDWQLALPYFSPCLVFPISVSLSSSPRLLLSSRFLFSFSPPSFFLLPSFSFYFSPSSRTCARWRLSSRT